VIVDSGGGYQGFWLLDAPVVMEGERDDDARHLPVEDRNRRIEVALDGDDCHNIDRIMRLPGTVNVPGEKKRKKGRTPRAAHVIFADWSLRYRLDDFPPLAKVRDTGVAAPVALSADLPRLESLDDLPPSVSARTKMLIVNGDDPDDPTRYPSRSEVLFAVLCEMVRADVSDDIIAACILDPDYGISAHVLEQPRPQQYAARQIARAKAEVETPELAEMNAKHAFVTYGNKGRVLLEQDGQAPLFLEKQTLFDKYANRRIEVGTDKDGNPVTKPLGKWWFEHPLRREYEAVEFVPGSEPPAGTYNLYSGPAVTPSPGDCSLYLELIRDVIAAGDSVVGEYLLDWMALRLQRPGEKMETSIALRGGQGLGKSVFAERFGDLFGHHFIAVADPKQLAGNFNAHLQHALLVFGDEMEASHNSAFVGRLKTMVTQPRIRIEPKGVDSFDAPNCFALILAANNPHIVVTDADDRRYLVLDVATHRKNDYPFFAAQKAQWITGGKEAFAHMLMSRDLSGFEHRQKPRTSADDDVVELSFGGAERVVHAMLRSGETPPVWRENVSHTVLHDDSTGQVFLTAGDVAMWAARRGRFGHGAMEIERSIGRLLAKINHPDPNATAPRETVHGKQVRGTWMPPLPEARRRWCEMHSRSFDWGEGDDACWDVIGAKSWADCDPPF
jgi:hypothetical protein